MKRNQEYDVVIEKLVNGGKGIARIDNIPIFVENSAPGDVLKVKIKSVSKSYATAEIVGIIKPSSSRQKPVCSLHNVCGGCGLQHVSYDEQLNQKKIIVEETLNKIAGIETDVQDVIPSPKVEQYRSKVQYPVSGRKSGRIVGGYYKKSSHELINIKFCPMHRPEISEIMEFIKDYSTELKICAYDEKKHTGVLRHVIFRQSMYSNEILIIFVINDAKISDKIKNLADTLKTKFKNIIGICVNFNTVKTNVILGNKTICINGQDFYFEKLGDIKYKISAESFFQVNPYSAELIFNQVKNIIQRNIKNPTILDAYSGVSSFGIWLSDIATKIVSVEECSSASNDAIDNVKLNNIKNLEVLNGDAALNFEQMIKNSLKFDVVLVDPPRSGLSDDALQNVINLAEKYILYVSCNPATLARDLKFLHQNSFELKLVQPVDMFPNTPHIETIALLKKL